MTARIIANPAKLGGLFAETYDIQRVDRLHARMGGARGSGLHAKGLDAEAHDDAVWAVRNETGWDADTAAQALREWEHVRRICNGSDSLVSRAGALRLYARNEGRRSAHWIESLAKIMDMTALDRGELAISFECGKCRQTKPARDVDIGLGGAQWCTTCVARVAKAMGVRRSEVRGATVRKAGR